MKFIWSYLKGYSLELLSLVLGTLLTCLSIIGLPTVLARMIDQAIIGQQSQLIGRYALYMFVLVLIGFLARSLRMYMASRTVTDLTMHMRNDVYEKMQELSHHEFQELGVPSLTNRITSDAFIIMQFIEMILKQGMMAPIMMVGSIYMIARTSPQLGVTTFPVAPLIVLFVVLLARITRPLTASQQENLDGINRILRESITGLRVIRAFNRQDFQNQRLEAVNRNYRNITARLFKLMALTPALFSLTLNLVIIAIVWFGADHIAQGNLQVGTLVAFIEYVVEALFSLIVFANVFMMFPRASVSAHRLQEIMDTPISVQNPDQPQKAPDQTTSLEFRNVDFVYPDADEPVLRDISFKVEAGQTLAFIGSTGSGKSTIVKLIPRFYDVTKGQILINGLDIRQMDLEDLRDKIGYTPQKALLFKGEISDNLRHSKPDANLQDMDRATSISQAKEFIDRLPEGYASELAEGGSNLSGGQKQRLSIARSIIKGRDIYIFDDSFSALDYKTDTEVRQALKEITQDAATVIVAQRVATILHADQIIVLNKGQIVGQGTHQELLDQSPIYYEIASSQLSEEELRQ